MGVISKCCVLLAVLGFGCTKKVNECTDDSECKDIAYPFCDVDGQYTASGGDHNVCTIVPPDCPVDRCGCAAGAVTCSGDQLATCNTDGKSQTVETCTLGCAATNDRCFTFKPANNLNGAMTAAAGEPTVTFPATVTIDTGACTATDAATLQALTVKSLLVSQVSAPSICVLYAGAFDISNANVTGPNAVAFVSPGAITIRGRIDAKAKDRFMGSLNAGPGAVTVGACVGMGDDPGGGGGNATPGSDGLHPASVPQHTPGGLAVTNFEPLFGGCIGGGQLPDGGGGGGAVQLDSFTKISILQSALVALGGVGGGPGSGGGSGGTALLEAPVIEIFGGVTANGGGGGLDGTCGENGADATDDAMPALGAVSTCNTAIGGNGGTGATAPTLGVAGFSNVGGGGSVGRILIRTADGMFPGPGSIFSIAKTTDTLVKI